MSKFLSANFPTLQKDMIFPIIIKSMLDAEVNDAKSQFDINEFSGGPQRAFLQCRWGPWLYYTNDLPADDSLDCEEDAVGKEAKSASIEPLVGHPRSIVAH